MFMFSNHTYRSDSWVFLLKIPDGNSFNWLLDKSLSRNKHYIILKIVVQKYAILINSDSQILKISDSKPCEYNCSKTLFGELIFWRTYHRKSGLGREGAYHSLTIFITVLSHINYRIYGTELPVLTKQSANVNIIRKRSESFNFDNFKTSCLCNYCLS